MTLSHTAEQIADTRTPTSEQVSRPLGLSDRAFQFEVIPNVCLVEDVCRILRFSERQFSRLMRQKALPLVEIHIDSTRRFTGESVARAAKLRRKG
jgi:hypothetical protein